MTLIDISPNARSAHYQCQYCGKKLRAAAGTPDAYQAISEWDKLNNLIEKYGQSFKFKPLPAVEVTFEVPAGPLPYEQTVRSSIPEAVRAEVWRRDGGRCVRCGTKENLQFDHIIPVSKGGATAAQNLQILCQQCNLAKGTKI